MHTYVTIVRKKLAFVVYMIDYAAFFKTFSNI